MKRVQLWEILKESKPFQNKKPDLNKAKELLYSQINVKESDEEVTQKIRQEIKYFKKNQSKAKSTHSQARDELECNNIIIFEKEDSDPSPQPRKKINKGFKDLCPFRKRERTDKILNEIKCFL